MLKTIQFVALLVMQFHAFSSDSVPDFSAVYDGRKNTVKIKWQNKLPGIKAFVIQRSSDNATWKDIAMHIPAPGDEAGRTFFFEDKNPVEGENYYRLKYTNESDKTDYTEDVMVITGSSGRSWVMYPVPVKDMLTLQYKGSEPIKGVITVLIQMSSGKIITRVRNSSLSKLIQIPVSNLGGGIYDVRIIVENEILWNQRFIK